LTLPQFFAVSTLALTSLLTLLYSAIATPEIRRSGLPFKIAVAVGIFGGALHSLMFMYRV
jgi:hypothetical protein